MDAYLKACQKTQMKTMVCSYVWKLRKRLLEHIIVIRSLRRLRREEGKGRMDKKF